jgi:hypothetical protein
LSWVLKKRKLSVKDLELGVQLVLYKSERREENTFEFKRRGWDRGRDWPETPIFRLSAEAYVDASRSKARK